MEHNSERWRNEFLPSNIGNTINFTCRWNRCWYITAVWTPGFEIYSWFCRTINYCHFDQQKYFDISHVSHHFATGYCGFTLRT